MGVAPLPRVGVLVVLALLGGCADDAAPEAALPQLAASEPTRTAPEESLTPLQARREYLTLPSASAS